MTEELLFRYLIVGWFGLAVVVFTILFFFVAPYGRHVRKGWGPVFNNTLGWIFMEFSAPIVFALCYLFGERRFTSVTLVFFVIWEIHYVHRAFIYPFTIRSRAKHMSLVVIIMGFIFNTVNGYLNGRYLFHFSRGYQDSWLKDPRFILGLLLIIAGFIVNRQADTILRNLRKPGENGYRIPYGSLYKWISCPNYLGEISIWTGWAIATWSTPGLAFAVWTAANLIPRARAHHLWYHQQFPDYPNDRRALFPGIW